MFGIIVGASESMTVHRNFLKLHFVTFVKSRTSQRVIMAYLP